MKKWLCVILSLLMVSLSLVASAELAVLDGSWHSFINGTWYLVELRQDDVSLSPDTLGLSMEFTCESNLSAPYRRVTGDEVKEGTGSWFVADGGITVTIDGETTYYLSDPENELLLGEMDGMTAVFSQNLPVVIAREQAPDETKAGEESVTLELSALGSGAQIAVLDGSWHSFMNGTWYLVELRADGITIDPSVLGMRMEFTLNADQSCTFLQVYDDDSDESAGTWFVADGGIELTIEGDTLYFRSDPENELLLADLEGMTAIFSQTPPQATETEAAQVQPAEERAETVLPPEIAIDETAAAFPGTWQLTGIRMGTLSLSPDALGKSISFTLYPDGNCTYTSLEDGEQTGSWSASEGTLVLQLGGVETSYLLGEDGYLTTDLGGSIGEFTKVEEAVTEANFIGTWTVEGMIMGETTLPAQALGMNVTYVIAPGTATEISGAERKNRKPCIPRFSPGHPLC